MFLKYLDSRIRRNDGKDINQKKFWNDWVNR